MRVCVCNDLSVDAIRETVLKTCDADPVQLFRVLGKRFVCGNCRNLVGSVAELSLRQSQRKT